MAFTSLDIIVPTYNEETLLPGCLESLTQAIRHLCERYPVSVAVLVVDADSTDRSREIAQSYGYQVLAAKERGRGLQLSAGIAKSRGELILMLHADSTIEVDGLSRFYETYRSRNAPAWGILGHRYAAAASPKKAKSMQWVKCSNFLRFACLGIAFGDQGIFVQREHLEAVGGMPEQKLMEDVELSLRLRSGRTRMKAHAPLHVSTRRWEKKGSFFYTIQVLRLVSEYVLARSLGADTRALSDTMYLRYYGK